ncbi:MAG: hypothetical protein IAE77_19300 [Prosthecobacter sp.]|jgi:hypothetical protein|uniref:hypothetical protein n=1 Tax=Prosthecobacter sp. TaxID=1965333 RepID=UPI0019E0D5F1|nr:hypothetical protein [Prosthecobacter sp.]MBE2285618.1 hypothetical protein [Prosthecobacter sp.]
MVVRFFSRPFLNAVGLLTLAAGSAGAHVVPNMTVEAEFAADGRYALQINVDPRTFLASDPTSLPPVPASWYQEQSAEQAAATKAKAQEYLVAALGLLFGGQKTALPACEIQPIDGEDNTPLEPDTQEVHFLARVQGSVPPGAASFQVDFAKDANTTLILLPQQKGGSAARPQVIFPGETSRPFELTFVPNAKPGVAPKPAASSSAGRMAVGLLLAAVLVLLFQGWRLLNKYRHHHRWHQRPKKDE